MPKRVRIWPRFLAAALAFLLCGAAFGADARSYETPDAEKFVKAMLADADAGKTLRVQGKTLMQAYKTDEAAADSKYKGKTLLLETSIDLVSRDIFGTLVVYLKSGSFMPIAAQMDKKVTVVEGLESDAGLVKVRQLPAEEAATLLKRGQPLHLVCKGAGYNLGSPELVQCNMVSF
ncbi:hypothetical protein [Rhodoferax sp.]|uniref:OB-fold protein n=1 Tax=Rhodoferax sp. TaxID=50421 RepID=UPI00374D5CAD